MKKEELPKATPLSSRSRAATARRQAAGDSWCPETCQGWIYTTIIALVLAFGAMPWIAQMINGCHEGDAYWHGVIDGKNEAWNLTEKLSWKATTDWCKTKGFQYGSIDVDVINANGSPVIHCQREDNYIITSKHFPLELYQEESMNG